MKNVLILVVLGILLCPKLKAEIPYYENDSLLRTDLHVVWPMVLTVKVEYDLAKAQLEFLQTKDEKEQFMEEFEDFVKKKYFKEVIGLNYKQGKLLLLLIHRELGKTPYDLLKEYRNLSRANFWQRFAKIVGANLKEEYSPEVYPVIEREILLLKKSGNMFLKKN